jgi:putative endonuclease
LLRRQGRAPRNDRFLGGGFTSHYKVVKLVCYEMTGDVNAAIAREKQIKAGSRQGKIDLVDGMTPDWLDLDDEL